MRLGLTTMIRAPRLMARRNRIAMTGWGAEAALDAEHPLARRVCRHVVRHHREPVILANGDGDAVAYSAVRARRLDPADDLGRRLLGPERARPTGGHALAAGRADR